MNNNTETTGRKEFELIYNRYFSFFFDVAFHFLHDEDDAKNMVQEAFIKLWETSVYTKAEQEIKNYLFILIRNRCLNILRNRKKNHKDKDVHKYLLASINYRLLDETGEDILLYQELFTAVQNAISNLSPQCKEAFSLSRFDDLTNKEIAEKLNITVKAVEANITRALKQLRSDLSIYLVGGSKKNIDSGIRTVLISFL